jgi:SRSO17 transposase
MDESAAFAFRNRLCECLELFTVAIKTAASRRHFCNYVSGLPGSAERKNMERMAFKAGFPLHTLQEFLAFYVWEEDAVRRRVQRLVAERYADANAIAIIDETGVPKKGVKTAGVRRQYCGAVGKIENRVMFVGLAYAAGEFHTLVDLDSYLPKTWAESKTRRREAGIPEDMVYRSKQDMSVEQLKRAISEGMTFRRATADGFYGRSSRWRRDVAELGIRSVVEVPKSTKGWLPRRIASIPADAPDSAYAPREVGLDHFEVHKYRPLVRHLRLALAGMLFLSIERTSLREETPWRWSSKSIRQLVAAVLTARSDDDFLYLWAEVLREREYYEPQRQRATISHGKKRLRRLEALGSNGESLQKFEMGKIAL